jgi:hypothetical protein
LKQFGDVFVLDVPEELNKIVCAFKGKEERYLEDVVEAGAAMQKTWKEAFDLMPIVKSFKVPRRNPEKESPANPQPPNKKKKKKNYKKK